MAITIRKNENQKGTTYTVTVRVPGHKSQTKTYKRKKDADTWGKNTELEIQRREFVDPKDLQLTLGDALKKYLDEVSIKKTTTAADQLAAIRYIMRQKNLFI